jgi:preprotein translocase subunit YajC
MKKGDTVEVIGKGFSFTIIEVKENESLVRGKKTAWMKFSWLKKVAL